MIGVLAQSEKRAVVAEFFELFKTPWEWAERNREYDVLLSTVDAEFSNYGFSLILLYSGIEVDFDKKAGISGAAAGPTLKWNEERLPIYGDSRKFRGEADATLLDEQSSEAVLVLRNWGTSRVVRIGYDLFAETHHLLTVGQPVEFAGIATLELHIALLKSIILAAGIPVAEIPPTPAGFRSITCLTHDIDHPSIRGHCCDHTMFGFLRRAVIGSLVRFLRDRITLRDVLINWGASLRLPLVYVGLAKDFWADFAMRYVETEKGIHSTFFVIPFKDRAGMTGAGSAPRYRAAAYSASDIAASLAELIAAGCEVGLHGLDAWHDVGCAAEEFEEIRRVTGVAVAGVRMHWLYYGAESPAVLEQAGATYDSTIGYRETVGYRAGTTQAFKPLGATKLLELPMQVMDTALFYPAYMGLLMREARSMLQQFAEDASRFGGCLIVNWHDRSLAVERLWSACYRELLDELRARETWFATCAEAAAWFRKRRSVVFERDVSDGEAVRARMTSGDEGLPSLVLRTHMPLKPTDAGTGEAGQVADVLLVGGSLMELRSRQTV